MLCLRYAEEGTSQTAQSGGPASPGAASIARGARMLRRPPAPAGPPALGRNCGCTWLLFLTRNPPTKTLMENIHDSVKSTYSKAKKGGGNFQHFGCRYILLQEYTRQWHPCGPGPCHGAHLGAPDPRFPLDGISRHFPQPLPVFLPEPCTCAIANKPDLMITGEA